MTALSMLAWRDREHRAIGERIRKFGVSITMVGSGECGCGTDTGRSPAPSVHPFAYTTGLFGIGHPELLIFESDPVEAGRSLNALSHVVLSGQVLVPGQYIDRDGSGYRGYVEEVPNAGDIVFAANDFYRRPPTESVPVLQITFSDHTGRMPWEDGYRGDPGAQPRPGEFRA